MKRSVERMQIEYKQKIKEADDEVVWMFLICSDN